jgi:hypothetical protein
MRFIPLALLAAMASCHAMTSTGPAVQTAMSQNAPFPRYHTFSFGLAGPPPDGSAISARSLEAEWRTRELVIAALTRKGYVEVRSKADVIVRLSSGTREVLHSQAPDNFDPPPSTEEASVSIDMYDAATGLQVWHGYAVAEIDSATVDEALLQRGVEGVFAGLPVQNSPAPMDSLAAGMPPGADGARARQ